jgi:hypothetical protein
MLGTLSPRPRHDDRPDDTPRQFVFADGHGGVEKIRIDLEAPHLDHVREALDTNPDASRVAVRGVPTEGTRAPDEPRPIGPRQVVVPAGGIDLDDDTDVDLSSPAVRSGAATRVGPGDSQWDRGVVDAAAVDDEQLDLLDDLEDGWADLDDQDLVEPAELEVPTQPAEGGR